jgi:uncharacterized protein (DUF58 family)
VTRRASPRLRAYLVLGAGGLILGAFLGRPEPVILVAPMLIAAILALVVVRDPDLAAEVSLSTDRILEGDDVQLDIHLRAPAPVRWLEVAVALPAGLAAAEGQAVLGIRLEPDVEQDVPILVSARRWGVYRFERVVIRIRDRFGFFAYEETLHPDLSLRVFPRPETLRRAIRPAETQVYAGDEVARRRGDGIEFADVRPYSPGDQIRSVNWRLSSRRPELHVNLLHPERATDVVILLDTFTDVPGREDQSSLTDAVRAAHGIANHYLRRRDRVGLIAFGGSIRWLVPSMGLTQAYRIVDSLLDARATMSMTWMGVEVIPPRSLPPKALVVALSPLLDDKSIEALLDLRGRGFDLAVIELEPEAYIAGPTDAYGELARRIWRMRREQLHDRFRRLGVPVAAWSPGEPLEAALEEVRTFRRNARRASA